MRKINKAIMMLAICVCSIAKLMGQEIKKHKVSVNPIAEVCTGINNTTYDEFNFYPNPVEDILSITLNKKQNNTKVYFYNSVGALVKQDVIETSTALISIKDLPRGAYLIKLQNNENENQTFKIILK
jgi:hypothetical protein